MEQPHMSEKPDETVDLNTALDSLVTERERMLAINYAAAVGLASAALLGQRDANAMCVDIAYEGSACLAEALKISMADAALLAAHALRVFENKKAMAETE
jgi:hypothetical protein